MRLLPLPVLGALVLAAAGCSPVGGFCAAMAECDNLEAQFPFGMDTVGEGNDSEAVCNAEVNGELRQLRANEEPGCFEEANLLETYMACVGQTYNGDPNDACDALTFGGNNPCDDELEAYIDRIGDNNDDCGAGEE